MILVAALLGALAFALFSPAMNYGFVNFDDDVYVSENPHVSKGLSASELEYALTTRDVGTWAPLTWLSYELDTTLLGFRARSYHATNVLLHALAGVLLFIALQRLRFSFWASVAVSVLFLVHPLRSESVVWIAERKDVLCAFFWALGLVAYSSYAAKPNAARWTLVFASFAAGLMSKMMMVTFPFVLLLLDFWPLRRVTWEETGARSKIMRLFLEKVPFFGAGVASLFITSAALKTRGALHAEQADFWHNLLQVPANYCFYLQKIFWPADLSVLYPVREVQAIAAACCTLLLGAITLVCLWKIRKAPSVMIGWLWFLGTLVPVVGFVPFGDFAVADRYSYIPSIGLALACVVAVEHLFPAFLRARWFGLAAVAIACAAATAADLPRWRDSLTLYSAAFRVGDHYVAYNNHGTALYQAGQLEPALKDFDKAIQLKPTFAEAHNNRGSALSDLGRYEEALQAFDKALACDPNFARAYDNRGNVYARMGQTEAALREYNRCLQLRPDYATCFNNRAAAYFQLQRLSEALADIESCRHLGGTPHPGLVQALINATNAARR